VPLPYLTILNVATFLFVYATPFLYSLGGWEGRVFGVQLLVVAYYGLLSVGESIENPFAWDTFGM
jgi:predicted membrane chloride channel (bestrophin family)